MLDAALAEEACHIEIERLGDPVGKQDQYIAAFGGITRFEFRPDDTVDVERARGHRRRPWHDLEDHLLLFFTGYSRRRETSSPTRRRRPRTTTPR